MSYKFAVVDFFEEGNQAVVSTRWLSSDNTVCRWPRSPNIGKLVLKHEVPSSKWTTHKCVVLKIFDVYEKARSYSSRLELTSNPETATEEDEPQKKQRKVRKVRENNRTTVDRNGSSSESEGEERTSPQFKTPKLGLNSSGIPVSGASLDQQRATFSQASTSKFPPPIPTESHGSCPGFNQPNHQRNIELSNPSHQNLLIPGLTGDTTGPFYLEDRTVEPTTVIQAPAHGTSSLLSPHNRNSSNQQFPAQGSSFSVPIIVSGAGGELNFITNATYSEQSSGQLIGPDTGTNTGYSNSNQQNATISDVNLAQAFVNLQGQFENFQEKALRFLIKIDSDNQEILRRTSTRPAPTSSTDDVPYIPVSSLENFRKLNEWLAEDTNFNAAVNTFSCVGGSNPKNTTHRVLARLIENEIAKQLSLTGRGKKSEAGLKGQPILKLIYSTVPASIEKGQTESDIDGFVQQWLKNSYDRSGGREQRRKLCHTQPPAEHRDDTEDDN